MDKSPINPLDLRRAFGSFATGVTIVTTADAEGEVYGFTANSFSSVSLDPPLLLVNIARSAYGLDKFTSAAGFVINVLAESQRELSNTFAARGADKFAEQSWSLGHSGAPIFDGVVAWFDCECFQQVEAGDHVILIGRVRDYGYNSDAPLGFCRGAYVSFGLSPQMLQLVSSTGTLRVGALIENKGKILLQIDPANGEVKLPVAENVGSADAPDSLAGMLAAAGIDVQLPFLFSAFHHGDTRYVYYRGDLLSMRNVDESGTLQFVAFDQIPWLEIKDTAVTSMLQRYIKEHSIGNYAVYIGDQVRGDVHPVNPQEPK